MEHLLTLSSQMIYLTERGVITAKPTFLSAWKSFISVLSLYTQIQCFLYQSFNGPYQNTASYPQFLIYYAFG